MPSRTRLTTAALLLLPAWGISAQDDATDSTEEAPAGEVTIGERGSEQDPLSGRDSGLVIEPDPVQKPTVVVEQALPGLRLPVDPRVLGVAPGEPLPPLRREGETLRKRDARLLPADGRGYAVVVLDADPEAGDEHPLAMIVAPCTTLESMERMQQDRGEELRFTITGQVYTYRGVNYLLPTSPPKPWLMNTFAEDGPIEEAVEQPGDAIEADTTEAEQTSASSDPADEQATPTADEVLEQLLAQRRESPNPNEQSTSEDMPGGAGANAPAPTADQPRLLSDPLLLGLDTNGPQAELKDEGQFIIARAGRLIRSADGALPLFVLDSDDPDTPEPPMILQACKLLEDMEQTVQEQGDNIPFVITGQVFVYRGANYLLPTIVKREFERGNLE